MCRSTERRQLLNKALRSQRHRRNDSTTQSTNTRKTELRCFGSWKPLLAGEETEDARDLCGPLFSVFLPQFWRERIHGRPLGDCLSAKVPGLSGCVLISSVSK